ncbi:MAG: hypothetical protein EHM45_19660, partial [Desulfobacteraceae bacterium]
MNHKKIPVKSMAIMLLFILIMPLLPLLISQRWNWWEAWVYALMIILGFTGSRLWIRRRHPDLLTERAHFMQHTNTKP